MPERLITPEDFTTGAPPRLMGTEAEDHVGYRNRKESNDNDPYDRKRGVDADEQLVLELLSPDNFERAKIGVFHDNRHFSNHTTKWLVNGQRVYKDQKLLESCTAEQLGPRKALAGTMAGIRTVEKLADASGKDIQIFRRSATVSQYGTILRAGFHLNHITSEYAWNQMDDSDGFSALEAHAATRLYSWEGMVAPRGFTLSQKAHAYRNVSAYNDKIKFYKKKDESDGFVRIEDYSADFGSLWGTFMAMATTSVLLRVLEHTGERDLNKRLRKLKLEQPDNAIQAVSADNTFKETVPLADGRQLTAIQIQTELADIASEFGKRFTLPEDEQYAIDEWQRVCKDLQKAAESENLRPLATRIGFVAKKLWLERPGVGTLHSKNPKAVKLDMSWDCLYPQRGGRLIFPQKTGLTIVTDDEIAALVHNPPEDNRAAIRSQYLESSPSKVYTADWGAISFNSHRKRLHPYQTEE